MQLEIMDPALCESTLFQFNFCFLEYVCYLWVSVYRLGCHTTTNCTLGGSAINGRNQKPFETGQKAANELIDVIRAKSCVDTYIQDQLIIFMALAKGVSRIRCSFPLTLHTQTAIYITELMTKVTTHST